MQQNYIKINNIKKSCEVIKNAHNLAYCKIICKKTINVDEVLNM